jgi:hypothetical protein
MAFRWNDVVSIIRVKQKPIIYTSIGKNNTNVRLSTPIILRNSPFTGYLFEKIITSNKI